MTIRIPYILVFVNYLSVSVVCTFLSITLVPLALKPDNWTKGKYVLCTFIDVALITFGTLLFEYFSKNLYGSHLFILLPNESSYYDDLMLLFLFNFISGIIISVAAYFFIINNELDTLLKEKDTLNKQLASVGKTLEEKTEESLVILSGTTKDKLVLNPTKILYIESSGNYVKINFLEDRKVTRKILRTTIQLMEDALKAYPTIIRCHRAFIVNISYIEKINANQQGFLLVLKIIDKEVPVSRTHKKNLISILEN
ncbi:MAG: LytTR family transcriptional regulator [Tannerella sp.]|nr:LytTR family transcriptional regulator [Tannerella sp.]